MSRVVVLDNVVVVTGQDSRPCPLAGELYHPLALAEESLSMVYFTVAYYDGKIEAG